MGVVVFTKVLGHAKTLLVLGPLQKLLLPFTFRGSVPLTRFQLTRFFLFFSSDSQAIITVGGAATKCQHQSPCYDNNCKACYDPLLRIHGKCGGASYFTCRGSLPRDCMPYTCTYRVSYENS